MDTVDRLLINELQGGFPLAERPFGEVAARLGLDEDDVIRRIGRLLDANVLTRFGPLFDAERMGGGLTLAAMKVPAERFDEVASVVNGFAEVAHNYARDHELNMWFVVATENPRRIGEVLDEIGKRTGLAVFDMPKEREFFLSLRLDA